MKNNQKSTVFSGVQPTGNFHLGNYFGALTQWLEMQKDYRCIFSIVDYHAITVKQDPAKLQRQILDVAKIYLATGINPKQSIIFRQSAVPEHTELTWLLNCASARMSDLENMTQYKDKAGTKNNTVGLFDYPVLMAADILLYQTAVVPVGEDQVQHLELTRDLAKRFNHDYGPAFVIPQVKIRQEGARIMGLDDPSKKMSKSATSPFNYIGLLDEPELVAKKIKRAVTDSGTDIVYDPKNKPAVSNLLTIYSLLAKKSYQALTTEYKNQGYGQFKADLADLVVAFIEDFQERFRAISDKQVIKIMDSGAKAVRPQAQATIKQVKKYLGL